MRREDCFLAASKVLASPGIKPRPGLDPPTEEAGKDAFHQRSASSEPRVTAAAAAPWTRDSSDELQK